MSKELPMPAELAGYVPSPDDPDTFDSYTGTFTRHFLDPRTDRYLVVEAAFGYQRPIGGNETEYVFEPHVIVPEYIQASEGYGLGTAGLRVAITEGLCAGLHQARMQIINSKVIGMIERLQRDGSVLAAYFRIDPVLTPHALVSTDAFHEQPDICHAEEATKYLQEREQTQHGAPYGAVDCVIWF